jgi:putative transposase
MGKGAGRNADPNKRSSTAPCPRVGREGEPAGTGDADFSRRWSLIKSGFSRGLSGDMRRSSSKIARRERGIWQRRYCEHAIRDDADLEHHVDYIHFNPVKHGHASQVCDWPHSSFHRYVARGVLPRDGGGRVRETTGAFGE